MELVLVVFVYSLGANGVPFYSDLVRILKIGIFFNFYTVGFFLGIPLLRGSLTSFSFDPFIFEVGDKRILFLVSNLLVRTVEVDHFLVFMTTFEVLLRNSSFNFDTRKMRRLLWFILDTQITV